MDFIWWSNRRLPSWRNGYGSRADEARSAAAERRSLDSAAQWTAVARYQAVNSERRRPGPARLGYNLAALQSMNPVIPSYTVAAVMLNLYATGAPAGHWTGPLKQHAGLKPGFGSIRPLLPIFTSFLYHGQVPGPGRRPLQNERRSQTWKTEVNQAITNLNLDRRSKLQRGNFKVRRPLSPLGWTRTMACGPSRRGRPAALGPTRMWVGRHECTCDSDDFERAGDLIAKKLLGFSGIGVAHWGNLK